MHCGFSSIAAVLLFFAHAAVAEDALLHPHVGNVPPDFDFSCHGDDADSTAPDGTKRKKNDFHLRGTALGGWLVLEPWLTPSLFYQFFGATDRWGDEAKNHVAIDSYTFCTALGPEEANRQLRRHWASWVSEEQIANLAAIGVETLRIPVGDWMYKPYKPYIGCMDGASEELERVLRLCEKYGLTAVIDIHAVRGSQNGLDNSGDTDSYEWLPLSEVGAPGQRPVARYRHWDIRGGSWAGHYNISTFRYDSINASHFEFTLDVVRELMRRHKDDPVVVGVEPINEPWWVIPLDVLKEFYWTSYQIVQADRPDWVTLFHDSFRLNSMNWGGFMRGCDNWAIDTHIYQAWAYPNPIEWFEQAACAGSWQLWQLESIDVPIIVGEWSLATDNCAMWLNGFNDNVPGYPKVECERVVCPEPYMGRQQIGAPPDNTPGSVMYDPEGTGGESYVINGTCPRDRPFPNEASVIRDLCDAKLSVFDQNTHGQFFWNFRTEFEPRWDYQMAYHNGWLPGKGEWDKDSHVQRRIAEACTLKSSAPSLVPTMSAPSSMGLAAANAPAGGNVATSAPSHTLSLSLAEWNWTANVWTGTVAIFAIVWVLICCRRTQSLRGYMRIPEGAASSNPANEAAVQQRKRPVKFNVKDAIAL